MTSQTEYEIGSRKSFIQMNNNSTEVSEMAKHLKMVTQVISVFLISFLLLWVLLGIVRLHELNGELSSHVEECERKIEETRQKIEETSGSTEEQEELVIMKARYIRYSYLAFLEERILEEQNSILWSLLDVYSRQRALWWGNWSLSNADFLIDQWEAYFVSTDSSQNREEVESMIREKRKNTQCFPQYQPSQGVLNRRAYENTEPLRFLLEKICNDYEKEDELLYRAYQAEAASYLSKYIEGFSRMKWFEKPVYGWFPREGFVTFRYIWLDISMITAISFFVSVLVTYWRNK